MSAPGFTARPELLGNFGMVATTHWLASSAGMAMLEKGGNAFDAAVAAGLVLHFAEPHLNGPGGDMPLLYHSVKEGGVNGICGQGYSPAAMTLQAMQDLGLDLVPGTGLLPAMVPGAMDAWLLLLRDHGTMTVEEVFEPAIHYAMAGCPLVPRVIGTIQSVAEMFRNEWPTSAAQWLPGGNVPEANKLFRNEALGRTYQRLVTEAKGKTGREAQIEEVRRLFYRGFVAEAIDAFCRDNEVKDVAGRHRGLLTADDMASWQAFYEKPISLEYGDYEVFKFGPWNQGPTLLQQLALLKGFDLDAMATDGAEFVHTVVECMKLAFADREGFYGDPDFVDVPMKELLSDDYNDHRRTLVDEMASLELRPGRVANKEGYMPRGAAGRDARAPELSAGLGVGEPTVRRDGATGGDTCHIDIIDRWGNMVSATPSGGWLQSSPTIPEIGFCLGTRGQMFWLDPKAPAAIGPRRRPRSTLSPSFANRGGKPYMAFGTPGGDQQDQWSLLFFLRHVHHKLNLQEAIETPAFTSEHWPNSFWPRAAKPGRLILEGRFPTATVEELKRRGHLVEVGGPWTLGRLSAVTVEDGLYKAAANPRGMQGYAVGR